MAILVQFDIDNSHDSSLAMIENLDAISSETVPLILLFAENKINANDMEGLIERIRVSSLLIMVSGFQLFYIEQSNELKVDDIVFVNK
nr:hypothetical protein [Shigella flexneri]